MNIQDAVAYLSSCSASEFAKAITKINENRNLEMRSSLRNEIEERLVLCVVSRYVGNHVPARGGWEFEVIAPGNPGQDWSKFEGQGYWESGICRNCNMEIVSYAKSVLCPLCGSSVALT